MKNPRNFQKVEVYRRCHDTNSVGLAPSRIELDYTGLLHKIVYAQDGDNGYMLGIVEKPDHFLAMVSVDFIKICEEDDNAETE